MPDLFDQSQDLEAKERDALISRARRQEDEEGCSHCRDCGYVIEPARRAANPRAVRCIECQREHEG